ncbi:MAG: hypothetical protein ACI4XL_00610 [Bacillus sp. (in: firmicutes)]
MKTEKITKEEIGRCISLLHPDYQAGEVHIFHTFLDFAKWTLKNRFTDLQHIKKVFKGKTAGQYRGGDNQIHIYLFNHRTQSRYYKINVIHTIYHELRHYYQYNHQAHKWQGRKVFSYEVGDYRYKSSAIERDANRFAARMMIKHKDKLSYHLNIYPNWHVRGYE